MFMNDKLLDNDGGQGFLAKDFTFIQNALRQTIGLLARTNGERYILWGVLSDDKRSIIDGALVIDGEVYQVPALGAIDGKYLCFTKRQYDSRDYEDGSTNNVKETVDVTLSTETTGTFAYVTPASLQNVQQLETQRRYIAKHLEGDCSPDTGFQIAIEPSLGLNIGDIAIVSMNIPTEDNPNALIGGTMMAIVKKGLEDNPFANLYYQDGSQLFGVSLYNNRIYSAYSRERIPVIRPSGTVKIDLLIIKQL